MRLFYDEWSPYVNRQPMADDLDVNGEGLLIAIRQPAAGAIDWNEFVTMSALEPRALTNRSAAENELAIV